MKARCARTAGAVAAVMAVAAMASPACARIIGTDLEVMLGSNTASALEHRYGLYRDQRAEQRLERIGKQMVAVSGRPALRYQFRILDTSEVNALAVPGGWVYATRGLMTQKLSDDELAFVVGHEVAHIAHRHGVRQLEQSLGVSLALGLVLDRSATTQALVADLLQMLLESGYSRDHERDADLTAVDYMRATKYDAQAGVTFLRRLQSLSRSNPSALDRWFATHPPTDERIALIEEKIRPAQKGAAH